MDWLALTKDVVIPCLREFGLPVVVALGALALCGRFALSLHNFLTTKFVDLLSQNTGALTSYADAGREQAQAMHRLADQIAGCPERLPRECPLRPALPAELDDDAIERPTERA